MSRDHNVAADALPNEEYSNFKADLRIDTPLTELPWLVFPRLLREAIKLHELIKERKALSLPKSHRRRIKKRKAEGLKSTDPW